MAAGLTCSFAPQRVHRVKDNMNSVLSPQSRHPSAVGMPGNGLSGPLQSRPHQCLRMLRNLSLTAPHDSPLVLGLQLHGHFHILILFSLFQGGRNKRKLPEEGDQPGQARNAAERREAKSLFFQWASWKKPQTLRESGKELSHKHHTREAAEGAQLRDTRKGGPPASWRMCGGGAVKNGEREVALLDSVFQMGPTGYYPDLVWARKENLIFGFVRWVSESQEVSHLPE